MKELHLLIIVSPDSPDFSSNNTTTRFGVKLLRVKPRLHSGTQIYCSVRLPRYHCIKVLITFQTPTEPHTHRRLIKDDLSACKVADVN